VLFTVTQAARKPEHDFDYKAYPLMEAMLMNNGHHKGGPKLKLKENTAYT